MALIPCPECGRMVSPNADECPGCGAPVKVLVKEESTYNSEQQIVHEDMDTLDTSKTYNVDNSNTPNVDVLSSNTYVPKRRKNFSWLIVAIIILIVISVGIFMLIKGNSDSTSLQNNPVNVNKSISDFPKNDIVKELLGNYCTAIVENNFSELAKLYAPYVERYQSAYGESRNEVLNHHRNYDNVFKVYGKHSSIRWDTFKIKKIDDYRVEAVIVEDYTIDRYDDTKYSVFVLEKHFIINGDYQIVSVWDNQISKQKKNSQY